MSLAPIVSLSRLIALAAGLSAVMPSLPALAQSAVAPPTAASEADRQDYSAAERLLLMSDQLHTLKPPTTLSYGFKKAGSLEEGFDDKVELHLKRQPDGRCCIASGDFLTGARRMPLPDIEQAQGNPVILYFLERDIREMQRLTKGNANYFRKRIRMALYASASIQDASFTWRGKPVAGKTVTIRPYLDDPNHARFENFVRKQYVFSLSDAVPGGVVAIRTQAAAAEGSATLIDEQLLLAQAEPPARVAPPSPVAATQKQP
jgi:hypothetical protein